MDLKIFLYMQEVRVYHPYAPAKNILRKCLATKKEKRIEKVSWGKQKNEVNNRISANGYG